MIVQEYLSEGTPLVETSKNMTRELRHTGIRIIITTQGEYVFFFFFFQLGSNTYPFVEPTCVRSVLLDLCGIAIMHRFPAYPGGAVLRSTSQAICLSETLRLLTDSLTSRREKQS